MTIHLFRSVLPGESIKDTPGRALAGCSTDCGSELRDARSSLLVRSLPDNFPAICQRPRTLHNVDIMYCSAKYCHNTTTLPACSSPRIRAFLVKVKCESVRNRKQKVLVGKPTNRTATRRRPPTVTSISCAGRVGYTWLPTQPCHVLAGGVHRCTLPAGER